MSPKDGWRKARLAAGIVPYLRRPLAPDEALAEVRSRVDGRESNFLRLAEAAIFGDPRSPHAQLLRWAGWDYARLRQRVEQRGLEATLAALRDEGVRTSLGELKRRHPIRRDRLVIEPGELAFANRRLSRRHFPAATSGTSSGTPSQVPYDWSLFEEEAALECLLFESHGLRGAPCALWLPGLPSVSGIHNVLVQMRFRHPPERWFSQLPTRRRDMAALRYVRGVGRAYGMRVPLPEAMPFEAAGRVAAWMHSARERAGKAVLKTFASSAIRVADAALREGLELEGCVFFAGGEPLTERRRRFIASTGATVFGRYVATETGWIGGACPQSGSPEAMHLYSDRLALVPATANASGAGPLLFTTISPHAGMVLLNTDIGDAGRLRARLCSCALGRAGLEVEISEVHGHDKLSGDGMTVPSATLVAVLDGVIEAAGGPPDSYQLREEQDAKGASRLVVVLSPDVPIGDDEVAASLLQGLPEHGFGAELAARFWAETGAIDVRRERPRISPGGKLSSIVTRAR